MSVAAQRMQQYFHFLQQRVLSMRIKCVIVMGMVLLGN